MVQLAEWQREQRVRRLALVALFVLTIGALIRLPHALDDIVSLGRMDAARTPGKRPTAGAPLGVDQVAFVEWVRRTLPEDVRYWIDPRDAVDREAFRQWISYGLAPRLPASSPSTADVAVLIGSTRAPPARFRRLRSFAPALAIAYRR